jgi:uncharacterized protein
MKTALFLLLNFVFTISYSQTITESIDSKKLGEARTFTISLPANYEVNTDKKYPILLVLDGEYLLSPFEGILKYGSYWDDLPEMIIVAVNQNYNNKRFQDSEFDASGVPSGNGANFFEFIGYELLPYVEKKYRTQNFKIIAGHDTTACFLNFYLYKDNPLFNGYISLAPEMAPEMEKRVADRLASISKPIFYYQATAEGDLKELREKAITLNENIGAIEKKRFYYKFDDFKNATHYSLVTQAIPQALYFIFEGYQPISMLEFHETIVKMNSGYTKYLIDKYRSLEKKLGLKVQPRLNDFKAIEVAIIRNKAYAELQELSKYAEKVFPKTTLSVYHQALYYEKVGEYKKAVKEYRKAFTKTEVREITKDYMLGRSEALKNKKDDSKVEEYAEPSPESETTDIKEEKKED